MTYLIRHSERLDYYDENTWKRSDRYKDNKKDPPITKRGVIIAKDATLKILNDMCVGKIHLYKYIYSSPFSRCIDTSIVIARSIEMKTKHKPLIRIEYSLRELYPIPLQSLMDEQMKADCLFIKYHEHQDLFDKMYIPFVDFDECHNTCLNPLNEFYLPFDTIEKINKKDINSIICTHGLNLASLHIKFPTERITQISNSNEKKGRGLASYCYTCRLD